MSEKQFDAARYLTKLKGRDYLEVKWRLLWLRTEHPDAVIETELVEHDRQQRWCMFRATAKYPVYAADGSLQSWASATGYGQEDAAGFAGNPGDYPEKAETKALGRALAALGFGTQFTEDFDFAEGGERVVDSPIDRTTTRAASRPVRDAAATPDAPTANGQTPAGAAKGAATVVTLNGGAHATGRPESRPVLPATEPQVKAIYAIARGAQAMDDAEVDARCMELYGATPSALSRRQASEFIDTLKGAASRQ